MRLCTLVVSVFLCLCSAGSFADTEAGLLALVKKGSHVALMRHAIAPGTGDPQNFSIDDCATQRNLSDEGRQQATNTGEFLRANGIENLAVYTSQWCRCVETATLLRYDKVEDLPFLNSFYQRREREKSQTTELQNWLVELDKDVSTLLVTHQVNITALTGVYPSSGEIVVVEVTDGGVQVTGTIKR